MTGTDSSRSLVNAAKWKQTIVLLAGIFMNLLFAWILISISFNIGLLTSVSDQYKDQAKNVSVIILSVEKNSPADRAGFKAVMIFSQSHRKKQLFSIQERRMCKMSLPEATK